MIGKWEELFWMMPGMQIPQLPKALRQAPFFVVRGRD